VQIAPRLVGEALEKFAGEPEPERTRRILIFFQRRRFLLRKLVQPAPDQMRPAAEIHHTAREAFVHGHVRLAGEGILRMEAVAIPADAALVASAAAKAWPRAMPQSSDGVMRVHFQIAGAAQIQVHVACLAKRVEHVVKKREAGFDAGPAFAVEVEPDGNPGFRACHV